MGLTGFIAKPHTFPYWVQPYTGAPGSPLGKYTYDRDEWFYNLKITPKPTPPQLLLPPFATPSGGASPPALRNTLLFPEGVAGYWRKQWTTGLFVAGNVNNRPVQFQTQEFFVGPVHYVYQLGYAMSDPNAGIGYSMGQAEVSFFGRVVDVLIRLKTNVGCDDLGFGCEDLELHGTGSVIGPDGFTFQVTGKGRVKATNSRGQEGIIPVRFNGGSNKAFFFKRPSFGAPYNAGGIVYADDTITAKVGGEPVVVLIGMAFGVCADYVSKCYAFR
jgi:hypothetical protein